MFRGKPPSKGKPQQQASVELANISVQRAWIEQNVVNDSTRCSLPAQLASMTAIGRQVRITCKKTRQAGLYTVDELLLDDNPDICRMGLAGRQRLEISDPFSGTVTNVLTANHLSDAEAEARGEFVERLVDDGSNTGLIVLAAHGGMVERFTDQQAEHLTAVLSDYGASSWICKGWRKDGSAFDAWHIPSTDIHPASFPHLQTISQRRFAYAVSFHGMGGNAGLLVGGGAPYELRQQIAAAIRAAIPTSVPITVTVPTDSFNGDSPLNCVNWLTADGKGGIQLEQDYRSRIEYGTAIADAIAEVLATWL